MEGLEFLVAFPFLAVSNIQAVRLTLINILFVCMSLCCRCAQNLVNIITNPNQVWDTLLEESSTLVKVSLLVEELLS
tara:strand:- start:139 stop:369 length:231 start_codon:yes stop_codon:yes gene_type:complete